MPNEMGIWEQRIDSLGNSRSLRRLCRCSSSVCFPRNCRLHRPRHFRPRRGHHRSPIQATLTSVNGTTHPQHEAARARRGPLLPESFVDILCAFYVPTRGIRPPGDFRVKTGSQVLGYTCPRRDSTVRTGRHRRSVGPESRHRREKKD